MTTGCARAAACSIYGPTTHRGCVNSWLCGCAAAAPCPALVIKDADGRTQRFRCHGARATWWGGPQPALQLHLVKAGASDRFVVLSQQVEALNREVAFRRATEAHRARLLAAEQSARAQLQHLYDLTAALAGAITLAEVSRVVSEVAPAALGATAAEPYLHAARLVPPPQPEDNGLPADAGSWTDLDRPSSSDGSLPGEAADAVPLALSPEADGVQQGMLIVYDSDSSTTPEHMTAVAQQIAQALRRTGLHEHEHQVAERLQLSLLPQLPHLPGLEMVTCYAPGSDLLSVGGDWYDVYDVDADHTGLTPATSPVTDCTKRPPWHRSPPPCATSWRAEAVPTRRRPTAPRRDRGADAPRCRTGPAMTMQTSGPPTWLRRDQRQTSVGRFPVRPHGVRRTRPPSRETPTKPQVKPTPWCQGTSHVVYP